MPNHPLNQRQGIFGDGHLPWFKLQDQQPVTQMRYCINHFVSCRRHLESMDRTAQRAIGSEQIP